jgi:hypothetical protein
MCVSPHFVSIWLSKDSQVACAIYFISSLLLWCLGSEKRWVWLHFLHAQGVTGFGFLWVKVAFLFSFSSSRKIQKKIARKNKSIMCVLTNVCPLYIGLHMVCSLVYAIVYKEPYHAGMSWAVILFQFSDVASMVSVPRGM